MSRVTDIGSMGTFVSHAIICLVRFYQCQFVPILHMRKRVSVLPFPFLFLFNVYLRLLSRRTVGLSSLLFDFVQMWPRMLYTLR